MRIIIVALCLMAISAAGIKGGIKAHEAMLDQAEVAEIADLVKRYRMADDASEDFYWTAIVEKLMGPMDVYYSKGLE